MSGQTAEPARSVRTAELVVVGATYLVLAGIGVVSAGIEAFLVPQRLPHGLEGLSAVLAFVGNLAFGSLGGIGTKTSAGAVVPVLGWFVTVGILMVAGPGGDVVLPGGLPQDPGIPNVTVAFLLAGILAGGLALVLTLAYTRRVNQPTLPV